MWGYMAICSLNVKVLLFICKEIKLVRNKEKLEIFVMFEITIVGLIKMFNSSFLIK